MRSDARKRNAAKNAEPIQSPPFRDSDALRIIIRRLELIEDKMRRHQYDAEFKSQMDEVSEWLEWLAKSITARDAS